MEPFPNIKFNGADKFCQNLYYQDGTLGSVPRYNGNIAAIRWWNTGVGTDPRLGYRFAYDNAQRLLSAQAYVYSAGWVTSDKRNQRSPTTPTEIS